MVAISAIYPPVFTLRKTYDVIIKYSPRLGCIVSGLRKQGKVRRFKPCLYLVNSLFQSSAPSFVTELANLIPGSSYEVGLKAVSLESNLSKSEALSAFSVGDDLSKTLFDKDLQGRSVTVGHLSRFLKNTIRYLYGCFYIYLCIAIHGDMSNERNST